MAGSDESGEDMESGRTNRAEDRTRIWAQQEQGQPFNGDVIFIVEGAGDIEDDDYVLPSSRLHGILGSGVNEGVGVIGLDADHRDQDLTHIVKIGVFGRGETGVLGEGSRGPGVEGLGGDRPFNTPDGAGVIGRGGRQPDTNNKERKPHGAGVIGMGGGRSRKLQNDSIVGSVGVFGQGAEAETRSVDGSDHGPQSPGAGVVGRGGVTIPPRGPVAPGVVGLAGGADDLPSLAFEGDIGVYGRGATGVEGSGAAGPGVHGRGSDGEGLALSRGVIGPGVLGEGGQGRDPLNPDRFVFGAGVVGFAGDPPPPSFAETRDTGVYGAGRTGVKGSGFEGRGGVFQSERSAQVRLIPARRPQSREQASFTPTVIPDPGRLGPELPREGRVGDLMSTVDDDGQCSLWFCVREGTSGAGPARWAQVLLGPLFDGRA
jgi:hypothetical protein